MSSRRVLKGVSFSLVLLFLYVFLILPINYLNNGGNLFEYRHLTYNQGAVTTTHNLYGFLPLKQTSNNTAFLGGFPIAIALHTDGVIIEDILGVETKAGRAVPAAALKKGDFLIELGGHKIERAGDIERILNKVDLSKKPPKETSKENFISKRGDILGQILDGFIKQRQQPVATDLNGGIEAVVLRKGNKHTIRLQPAFEKLSGKYSKKRNE